jgi:arylsulfate sulfotransferase
MKNWLVSKTVLLLAVSCGCGFTLACGAKFNDPPGFEAAKVANTQNPLVAQYTVTSALGCPGQISVEFGPDTSYGRTTAWYPAPANLQQNTILVAGMRASTTYHMRARGQCADLSNPLTGEDLTFTTGPLPSIAFPTLAVTRPNPSLSSSENPGIEMVTVTVASTPALFADRDGDPIWYYDVGKGNYPYMFKLLPNGHMVLNVVPATGSTILREVDLAGNTIREMSTSALATKMEGMGFDFVPIGYHHDFVPLANGHLLVIVFSFKNFTDLPGYPGTTQVQGDGIIDLDANWDPVWAWNAFDYLDVNRHLNGLPDWTHSNALVYTADGNLLLSMRHQSWVLKIDYNNGAGTGNILWKLGYQGDFSLVQGDDPSLWFSFQHFPSIISQDGSQTMLAIWDNGDNRVLDSSGTICGVAPSNIPCYSRATIFQIDESTLAANLIWTDLPGLFGVWGGSINQLDNGNVEFDVNAPSVPPDGDSASEVQEVTQTSTPEVVWKMDLHPFSANAYRAYRVPSLYPGVAWQF